VAGRAAQTTRTFDGEAERWLDRSRSDLQLEPNIVEVKTARLPIAIHHLPEQSESKVLLLFIYDPSFQDMLEQPSSTQVCF
jgi:hypothetical protein